MRELSNVELINIDGGKKSRDLPGWLGFLEEIYDLGYGIGRGFAETARRI